MSAILIHNFNADLKNSLGHRCHKEGNYVPPNGWKMYYPNTYDDVFTVRWRDI